MYKKAVNSVKKYLQKTKDAGVPGLVILAIMIGIVGGLGAVFFHYLINWIKILFFGAPAGEGFLDAVQSLPWFIRVLIPTIGGLLIGPFITFVVPEAKGHGVPEVMEAVGLRSGKIRPLVAPLKALVSAVCIGSGGAAGREGPIVQIGSAFGSSVGQYLQLSPKKIETLLGAGAAAGIGGTFNAPLAGVIFSMEVLLKDIELDSFTPIVVASVVGTATANLLFGPRAAIFDIPQLEIASYWEFIPYIGLGVFAAGIALLFSNSLYSLEHVFDKVNFPEFLKPALGGLLLGLVALQLPQIHATGYPVMEEAIHGNLSVSLLFILMLAKILATDLSLGSGGSGGIFAPSLFIGAMMGSGYGGALSYLFPGIIAGASSYGMIGMGAVFAGATHAPLTSIIIIFEMTRDPKIFLPLMFACIISTIITSRVQKRNIYTTKLLNRGIDIDSLRETSVLRNIQVEEVMDTDLIWIKTSNTVSEARDIFKKTFYSHLPVIEEESQKFKGMLSYQQIMAYTENESDIQLVKELTFPAPIVVSPHDDLMKALKLTNKINIKYLPVLNDGGEKLLGLISRSDIIEAYHEEVSGGIDDKAHLDFSFHQEVEVQKMVEFSIRPIKKQAEEKDINIRCELEKDLPPVSADSHRISWVITNLLGDALRYSEREDDIIVNVWREDELVYISVSDNGPGIPKKYHDKIFEKYVYLSDEEEEGKGLGLSICKEIVEEHGGDIWVESEVGEGTTFTFTLEALPDY